ncbi:MAG: hypothetical protein CGW95_04585 [Phenylobacterium zucineum]|nr:MAG: hypothetical protein CGW95_04585 [Phenylobacterium zucineum]
MSSSNRFFESRVEGSGIALVFACLMVGGCTSVQAVASGKTMVPEITAISRAARPFPTFGDIPLPPTDLRPDAAWGVRARTTEADRLAVETATADNTWTLSGTEAFAAQAVREAGPIPASVISTTATTEAYVRELRRRATPPSPPKR